jgi:hypothetical protein
MAVGPSDRLSACFTQAGLTITTFYIHLADQPGRQLAKKIKIHELSGGR